MCPSGKGYVASEDVTYGELTADTYTGRGVRQPAARTLGMCSGLQVASNDVSSPQMQMSARCLGRRCAKEASVATLPAATSVTARPDSFMIWPNWSV